MHFPNKMRVQTCVSQVRLWRSNCFNTLVFIEWLLLNNSKQPGLGDSCTLDGIKSPNSRVQAWGGQPSGGSWKAHSQKTQISPLLEKMVALDSEAPPFPKFCTSHFLSSNFQEFHSWELATLGVATKRSLSNAKIAQEWSLPLSLLFTYMVHWVKWIIICL